MTQQRFVYGQVYELEAGWSITENQRKKVICVFVFVCVSLCVCVRACVRVCVF